MIIYTQQINENLSDLFGVQAHYILELSDQEILKIPEDAVKTSGCEWSPAMRKWHKEAWASGEIRHTDEFIQQQTEHMINNNPMKNPATAAKSVAARIANGNNNGHPQSDKEKAATSARMMGANNPSVRFPERSSKARPVAVYWADGTISEYTYLKALSMDKGIPYPTLKWIIRYNRPSVKHNITKIVQGCAVTKVLQIQS